MRIAVYGKGGIGKSTISSNLSYSLAGMGRKVVQIGCDPKCDSTKPLLKGRCQTTVTEYIRETTPSKRRLQDLVVEGSNGVLCIEAGGPRPGTGCAGKGIISMFSTLDRMGARDMGSDITLYDVLGDVVCGGFSVPMRPEHSDMVIIVTSGEYMSLFAANNIMKGSRQFESGGGRIAGLILNRRGLKNEDAVVDAFSTATGVPIIGRFDRSDIFRRAETEGCTVCEYDEDSAESIGFRALAKAILDLDPNALDAPTPLTDSELDTLYSEGRFDGRGSYSEKRTDKSYSTEIPVFNAPRKIGKGPVSAVLEAGKVTDIPVVIHGTASCGFTMLNEISEERISHLLHDSSAFVSSGENLICTNMTSESSVQGGNDVLRTALENLLQNNRTVIVISTCLPSMIGDDCERVISELESKHPGSRILFVDSNRVDSGFDAHIEVIRALTGLIDKDVERSDAFINVIDDNFISFNRGNNRKYLAMLASELGMACGPGFLNDCSVDEIVSMKRYGTAVVCEDTRDNRILKEMLQDKGIAFMDRALPRGLEETIGWIRELSRTESEADRLISGIGTEYADCIRRYKEGLDGRTVAILSWDPPKDIWIADSLSDCGCDVGIHSIGEGPYWDDRVKMHNSKESMVEAAASADVVIDCMDLDIPGSMTRPDTWLSHRASMDLIRRVWSHLRSDCSENWRSWGERYVS